MARIKKQGLDYFPLDTDFMQNRLVRRLMKQEGDTAFCVLMAALSCIYGGEGYYVQADEFFYEDLALLLYDRTGDDVRRILGVAADYGLFDAALLREHGILTSAEIQRQYLFCAKRRKTAAIDPRFRLLPDGEAEQAETAPADVCNEGEDVCKTGKNVARTPQNVASGAQSTAQHSTAKPLLCGSPGSGGTGGAAMEAAGEAVSGKGAGGMPHGAPPSAVTPEGKPARPPRREWSEDDIRRLVPPDDGVPRNYDGLLCNLRQHRIPAQEQYAIILKSGFGVIGHPVWRGFYTLRDSRGKIRQPGRYLLSLCT